MKKLFLILFLPFNLIAQDYYSFNHAFTILLVKNYIFMKILRIQRLSHFYH